MESKNPIIVQ